MSVSRRVVDGTTIVVVTGEVDMHAAPQLSSEVIDTLDHAAGEVCVVDLSVVTFLGSAGLTALLRAAEHAEAGHEPLRIVVDSNRPVIRPLEVTGLDRVLKLYHTVEEALAASHKS
jgi:anti-sigma B factor antagonist